MDEDVKGFRILSVIEYKSNKPLKNINQLQILNTLKSGIEFSDVDITKDNNCIQCQLVIYLLSGRSLLVFRKEVFKDNTDIVKLNEVFGDGLVCMKIIFISKHMFDLFIKHGSHKELVIESIILV